MDYIRVQYQDAIYLLGYELNENAIHAILTDGISNYVYFDLNLTGDEDSASVQFDMFEESVVDATLTKVDEDTVAIAIDRLLIEKNSTQEIYLVFDGAITVSVN